MGFGIRSKIRELQNMMRLARGYSELPHTTVINHREFFTYTGLLADKYHTDKGSNGSQFSKFPWPCHTYSYLYDMIFFMSRHSVKNVFECGIGSTNSDILHTMSASGKPGASLRMWSEYFPNAQVFGADIDRSVLFSDHNISTTWVDQLDPKAISDMWSEFNIDSFDVMIDDGYHAFDAGRTLFEHSIKRLSMSGIYIIEDVDPEDMVKYQEYFRDQGLFNVRYISLAEYQVERPDNNRLILITHDSL